MECGGKIKNMEELEFAIFCIESVAEKLGADGRRVYDALTKKAGYFMGILFRNMRFCTHRGKSTLWMIFLK